MIRIEVRLIIVLFNLAAHASARMGVRTLLVRSCITEKTAVFVLFLDHS
jgi:hypothetical protein